VSGPVQAQPRARFLEAEARALRRRLIRHMEAGGTTDLAESTFAVDAATYTDPQRFEAERRAVFREQPLIVGLSRDLPEPGSLRRFDDAGAPIVLVRGADGRANGFLNLCRHRGARLVEGCERRRRIVCPFHGWSYDLDGRLVGIPVAKAFEDLDRSAHGLIRVPVAEWGGLIFAIAGPGDGAIDAPAYLGPIAELIAALDLASAEPLREVRLGVFANWKLALDTFCEPYHVPALHPTTLAPSIVPYVASYDDYGLHHRYASPGPEYADYLGKTEAELPPPYYQAVHLLSPNTILTVGQLQGIGNQVPFYALFRIFPGAQVGEAITQASIYRPSHAPPESKADVIAAHEAILHVVETEDFVAAARAQANLRCAPAGHTLVLGRNEPLLQRSHQRIDALTRTAP
jgi:nitrite reductase/ring-hydroxylating ferredoxin subunit